TDTIEERAAAAGVAVASQGGVADESTVGDRRRTFILQASANAHADVAEPGAVARSVGAADGLVVRKRAAINDQDAAIMICDSAPGRVVWKVAIGPRTGARSFTGNCLVADEGTILDDEGRRLAGETFVMDGAAAGKADDAVVATG